MTCQFLNRGINMSQLPTWLSAGALFFLLLQSGCSDYVEVDFWINGQKLQKREGEPVAPSDTMGVYTSKPGDTIHFRDISEPSSRVKKRYWKDGSQQVITDVTSFQMPFEAPGYYKIILCINGHTQCTTHWVYVVGKKVEAPVMAEVEEVKDPSVTARIPNPPPPKINPPKFENKQGIAGPRAGYSTTPDCSGFANSEFSVTLKTNRAVELGSFVLYADQCGGVEVSLSGPSVNRAFKAALVEGYSQIILDEGIPRLGVGNYTLRCRALGNYSGCGVAGTPRFANVKSCPDIKSLTAPALSMDQKGALLIHELKFTY